MRGATSVSTKRRVAIALAAALVVVLVFVAATSGIKRPGVPSGDVVIVDGVKGGTVTQAQYDRALQQAAARLGAAELPPPSDPQFQQIQNEAMQGLLLALWAEGEAADRGLEVTDADVQSQLDQIQMGFKTPDEFAKVVRQSKFCSDEEVANKTPPEQCEDVKRQARLIALQDKLTAVFSPPMATVSEGDARDFYDNNLSSFQMPASRDVRVILNEDKAQVDKAKSELDGLAPDASGFDAAWKKAAATYSQDQASKDSGGLLQGLVQGQGDPQLEAEAFKAPVGELVGPFKTDRGFYLIDVVSDTPASTQPFDQAAPAIQQQLAAARSQSGQTELQNDFVNKWRRRTVCAPEVTMQLCSNYTPPSPEQIPGQPAQPMPPPVLSSAPIEPGTATFSIDGTTPTGLPQSPQSFTPPPQAAAGAGQSIPLGPDGQPVVPSGGTTGAPPGHRRPAADRRSACHGRTPGRRAPGHRRPLSPSPRGDSNER